MVFHDPVMNPWLLVFLVLFIIAGIVAVATRGPASRASVIIIALLLVMLSIIEIVTIPLSLIPVVGDLFGALSETLIEVIQALGIILLAFAGVMR